MNNVQKMLFGSRKIGPKKTCALLFITKCVIQFYKYLNSKKKTL